MRDMAAAERACPVCRQPFWPQPWSPPLLRVLRAADIPEHACGACVQAALVERGVAALEREAAMTDPA